MRLISAVSGVQIPAPPPFLYTVSTSHSLRNPKGGSMMRILSLLTVVLFLGIAGNALAQREVPPPANTPLDSQPAASQTKAAAKPVQAAKTTEKAKTTAKPAPVQAATVPITTESKTATAENQPEKAKKNNKTVAASCPAKKSATADKPKKPKPLRICKTTTEQSTNLPKPKKIQLKQPKNQSLSR